MERGADGGTETTGDAIGAAGGGGGGGGGGKAAGAAGVATEGAGAGAGAWAGFATVEGAETFVGELSVGFVATTL